jgi:subtilisin family serine protease
MGLRSVAVAGSVLMAAGAWSFAVQPPRADASGPGGPAAVGVATEAPTGVIVTFDSTTPSAARTAALSAVGGTDVGSVYGTAARILKVPGNPVAAAATLRGMAGVASVEVDGIAVAQVVPNDPGFVDQWASLNVRAPEAWDVSTGDASTVIAILDTGVRLDHPDLASNLVPGYDFVNGDSTPADDHGHGTLVAGAAAARGHNGTGVAGACWTCGIMPVKVAGSSGSASYSAIASGLRWAADRGARVANISFAGPTASTTLTSAVQYALSKNMLVVAAAGNAGTSTPQYPAAIAGVLSVGASNSVDQLYSYSNYGTWVDVSAPGSVWTTTYQGSYTSAGGTSLAAPLVAGIAALALRPGDGMGPAAMETALTSTAVRLDAGTVAAGRIDAAAYVGRFLTASAPAPAPTPDPSTTATPTPTPTATTVTVTSSGTLTKGKPTFTQSFTVAAGEATSTVTASKNTTIVVTVRDAGGALVATASGPGRVVLGLALTAGTYRVTVDGPLKTSVSVSTTYRTA